MVGLLQNSVPSHRTGRGGARVYPGYDEVMRVDDDDDSVGDVSADDSFKNRSNECTGSWRNSYSSMDGKRL